MKISNLNKHIYALLAVLYLYRLMKINTYFLGIVCRCFFFTEQVTFVYHYLDYSSQLLFELPFGIVIYLCIMLSTRRLSSLRDSVSSQQSVSVVGMKDDDLPIRELKSARELEIAMR